MEKFVEKTKKEIRKEMLQKRRSLEREYVEMQSDFVFEKLKTLPFFEKARSVFCYVDFQNEIKTDKICDFYKSKQLFVPKIIGDDMYACKISDQKKKNAYGIDEPATGEPFRGDLDLCIIPLVACDANGARIGFGKGYYDRFLKEKNVVKVGICYSWQVVEKIESEPHDVKLDYIVTEKEIIEVK